MYRLRRIVARTHGGLGNQLFQFFYALCKYHSLELEGLSTFHDSRYKHGFAQAGELEELQVSATGVQRAISSLRLVKILEKLRINRGEIRIGGTLYLDGYFQDPCILDEFEAPTISLVLEKMTSALGVEFGCTSGELYHLRLYDFFKNEEQRIKAASKILGSVPSGATVITTDDHLLMTNDQLLNLCVSKDVQHKKTIGASGAEVLRLMARYDTVVSNGSTLAAWAALLSGSKILISDERLKAFISKVRDKDLRKGES